MRFRQDGARTFRACMMHVDVDYEGNGSRRKGVALNKVIMPLIIAAPEMEAALRKIAAGDVPTMPTMLDEFVGEECHRLLQTIRALQEIARLALPKERKRPPTVNKTYVHKTP